MIVVIKSNASPEKRTQLIKWLKSMGLGVHESAGEFQTVLGLIGDTSRVDMDLIESLDNLSHIPDIVIHIPLVAVNHKPIKVGLDGCQEVQVQETVYQFLRAFHVARLSH